MSTTEREKLNTPPEGARSRTLRPREPIAVRPSFVSQHTAPIVLGFASGDAFLRWLPTSGCPVIVRGKDRLVRLEDAERALEESGGESPNVERHERDDQPETADAVLAALGLRRSA